MAHPDDADFTAAGTVAGWTAAGIEVTYCIATRGDQGGFDDTPRDQVPVIREREQRAAAAVLGVTDVVFLDHRDGYLEVSLDLRRDISRVIRQVRPQRVLALSPERNWSAMPANHPDHLAVGEATLRAVYPDARNQFAFPELIDVEGLQPWTVPEVWICGSETVNHTVDITDFMPTKIAALREHASQTTHADLEAMLRGWNGGVAAAAGLPAGRLAEAFRIVTIEQ